MHVTINGKEAHGWRKWLAGAYLTGVGFILTSAVMIAIAAALTFPIWAPILLIASL